METRDLVTLILSLPEAVQSSHFGNADFRVSSKIFAGLPQPDRLVLKLTRQQQEMIVEAESGVFSPVVGKWGEKGWTDARVAALDEASARSVLWMAWGNVAPKALQKAAGRA